MQGVWGWVGERGMKGDYQESMMLGQDTHGNGGGGVGDEGVVIDNRLQWSQVHPAEFHSGWRRAADEWAWASLLRVGPPGGLVISGKCDLMAVGHKKTVLIIKLGNASKSA